MKVALCYKFVVDKFTALQFVYLLNIDCQTQPKYSFEIALIRSIL
jgi:hypothetical protein